MSIGQVININKIIVHPIMDSAISPSGLDVNSKKQFHFGTEEKEILFAEIRDGRGFDRNILDGNENIADMRNHLSSAIEKLYRF